MLTPEEEQALKRYQDNFESMPVEVAGGYLTLPIIDVHWLVKRLKEVNEELKQYKEDNDELGSLVTDLYRKLDQLEGKA